MNIDYLKKSIKLALKEKLTQIKYGDNHRKPSAYIYTHTQISPFIFRLSMNDFSANHTSSTPLAFPKLSRVVLIELFSAIGVEYVPEICLYQLQNKPAQDVFYAFILTFGIELDNRLEEETLVDAKILNRVIALLMEMDRLREGKLFDSRPLYKLLQQHKFEKAELLMDKFRNRMEND